MTLGRLKARLGLFTDDSLEVVVRCEWEGDGPSSNVFTPRLCVQDIEPDTAVDFIAIECDQLDE